MDETVWGNRVSGNYDNNENSTLTSPAYTAMQNDPAIAFQHSFITEAGHDGGDFLYSVDGSNWIRRKPSAGLAYNSVVSALGDSGWSGNSSGWDQSVFTIPVDDDQPFWVRWRFRSDDGNNLYGWLIDEVAGVGCARMAFRQDPGAKDTLALAVRFTPGPDRGIGVVNFNVPTAGSFSVKLYSLTGALVARLAEGNNRKGPSTARLDARRLSAGVYFVKLACDGESRSVKFVVQ